MTRKFSSPQITTDMIIRHRNIGIDQWPKRYLQSARSRGVECGFKVEGPRYHHRFKSRSWHRLRLKKSNDQVLVFLDFFL